LVCAGVSAQKWIANREPDEDRRRIAELTAVLASVHASEFILISTIDVYPDSANGTDETGIIEAVSNSPYGQHRYELELWAQRNFENCRIIRLPALFGPGLKKNALFDLIHQNQLAMINPAGIFQWYPIRRLWSDIEIARRANLHLVNLFTEPLPMSRIIEKCFPGAVVGPSRLPAPVYRLTSVNASLFGGTGGFIQSADTCLKEIAEFVAKEKGAINE